MQIFTRDGAFVRKFGSHILQNPRGVTVDRLGNIVVVECKVQRVIVFCQQTGTILHKFSIMEAVEFPNGVATSNGCDKIYISDNQSHCVKVWSCLFDLLRFVFPSFTPLWNFASLCF